MGNLLKNVGKGFCMGTERPEQLTQVERGACLSQLVIERKARVDRTGHKIIAQRFAPDAGRALIAEGIAGGAVRIRRHGHHDHGAVPKGCAQTFRPGRLNTLKYVIQSGGNVTMCRRRLPPFRQVERQRRPGCCRNGQMMQQCSRRPVATRLPV